MRCHTHRVAALTLLVVLPLPVLLERAGVRAQAADVRNSRTLTLPSPGVPGERKVQRRVTLTYRGCARLDYQRLTGLSGITCAEPVDYYAVCDHPAQVVSLRVETRDDGSIVRATVSAAYPLPRQNDTEGIAISPVTGHVFVADESPGIAEYVVREFDRPRRLVIPELFEDIVPN